MDLQMKHFSLAGRSQRLCTGTFMAVLLFSLLQKSILTATCEELDNKSSNHADVVGCRFCGRIEAPNKTHILDTIFEGYDKRVRPHYREKPVVVSLYAVIDSFHDIKEEQMEYQVEVILKENWKDPRLSYGNASWFVRLKGDTLAKMWYPDTLIENSRKHDVDDKTRTAYLFGDGTIFLSEWIKATLTSHMDFHRYPMDVQTLILQIAGYSYDDTQVKYGWSSVSLREKDMTEFYVDKENLFLKPTSFITGTHTAAVAEFRIRRRLQHYILGFYLPCLTCTCASWIQFWMNGRDIAGRASVGTATVLAEIFLLQYSNQEMPKVSYLKAAELFVVVSFAFISLALVESAVVYRVTSVTLKRNVADGRKKTHKQRSSSSRGKKPGRTICEEFQVVNKGAKHDHDEELFERKIEAPNKTHILDALFKGYDKRVRPHYRGKPVLVSLYVVIDSFHDIKEEQMEYKVEVRLKEKWKDSRLAYGNASWFVRLKGETLAKVWYPDTLIENSRKHVVDDKTRTAFLFGDGTIYLSECIQSLMNFPGDNVFPQAPRIFEFLGRIQSLSLEKVRKMDGCPDFETANSWMYVNTEIRLIYA
ncbi:gamma-aminobutyric acid receptor subunit gamma-1-like [Montipora capricornis]|uniref:gamma-aminobutyric acid receptor subunit gamma-1-like n=1 Tax=Montipora capricornis TaxID=246305 RepID=UPI0035F17165